VRARSIAREVVQLGRDGIVDAQLRARSITRNRPEHRAHRAPDLTSVERSIVVELDANGFAIRDAGDVLGADTAVDDLERAVQAFAHGDAVRTRADAYRSGSATGAFAGKEFLVRLFAEGGDIPLDHPLLQVGTSAPMLRIADAYLGLHARLRYVDAWYTIPAPGATRTASQRWHRDWEDRRQVKVFLYHSDVDAQSGALEYVVGSKRSGGPHARWSSRRSRLYPDDDAFIRRIRADEIVSAAAPAGSLVFCDTTGLHRGGLAVDRERLVSNWLYVTPASYTDRRFRPVGAAALSDDARRALDL
jgi:hypothetical protein